MDSVRRHPTSPAICSLRSSGPKDRRWSGRNSRGGSLSPPSSSSFGPFRHEWDLDLGHLRVWDRVSCWRTSGPHFSAFCCQSKVAASPHVKAPGGKLDTHGHKPVAAGLILQIPPPSVRLWPAVTGHSLNMTLSNLTLHSSVLTKVTGRFCCISNITERSRAISLDSGRPLNVQRKDSQPS